LPVESQNPTVIVRRSLGREESTGLLLWLEVLWEQRRTLLRWILAGLVLAILLAVAIPAKYESTARVLPSENSSEAMMIAGSAASGAGLANLGMMSDLLGMKTPGALCAAILRSDTVLDGVINQLDLRKVYSIKDYDRTRMKLADRTTVSEDKRGGIVTVTVVDHSPVRAAAIANAYVAELDRVLQTLNMSAAHREREFLEKHIDTVKQNLGTAEAKLGQFSSKNSAIDMSEQGKAAFEVSGKVEGELIVAQSELQGLRQIYGPDHPRVRAAEAKVAQLRATAGKLGSTAANSADPEMNYFSISRLPLVGVTYADLFREVKVQEAIYEALLKQYEISKVEEAKATPRLRVIDAGQVPSRRASPRFLPLTALCLWLGLAAGVIAIMLRWKWDEADADAPWKRLGVRVAADLREPFARNGREAGRGL
jgi:uncharacterized protein involved in exopolysaccharide biosynthesis